MPTVRDLANLTFRSGYLTAKRAGDSDTAAHTAAVAAVNAREHAIVGGTSAVNNPGYTARQAEFDALDLPSWPHVHVDYADSGHNQPT
jgi:hypothetical protein